jgi:hypothetical protein
MQDRMIPSTICLFLIVITCGSDSIGEVISASPSQTVRGEITKIDGHTYVVRDPAGKEVQLRVDANTMMMDGTQLREGDTITADITAKGQASYIVPGPASTDPGLTRMSPSAGQTDKQPGSP